MAAQMHLNYLPYFCEYCEQINTQIVTSYEALRRKNIGWQSLAFPQHLVPITSGVHLYPVLFFVILSTELLISATKL